MVAVRYAALLALVIWLGGMFLLGLLVAPSTFGVLQAADPHTGRVLAGTLFGEVLRRFHLLAYACGLVILVSLVVIKFTGPPPRAFFVRTGMVVVMLLVAAYSGVPLAGEITRIQREVSGPVSQLPPADPRRVRFDRLHTTSTALMTVNMALGLVLLAWYVHE